MDNIRLRGLRNLRDLGGIADSEGRHIRKGLLFRSDALNHLTAEDTGILAPLLHTVLDLRTCQEREEMPNVPIPGVENIHIPMFKEKTMGITRETGADVGAFVKRSTDRKAIRAIIPNMQSIYAQVMTDDYILDRIGDVLHTVMEHAIAGKPILFHCSEGKDRTGAISAFLLELLGMDKQTIVTEYCHTNRVAKRKALINYILVFIFKADPLAAKMVYKAYIADERYLQAAFDSIDRQFGDHQRFFRERLHITDELTARFREAVLV